MTDPFLKKIDSPKAVTKNSFRVFLIIHYLPVPRIGNYGMLPI